MSKKSTALLSYVLLIPVGLISIFLASTIQQAAPAQPGEYFYSAFLRNNYTLLSASLLFAASALISYYLKLNPWLTGICMILIFPLVSIYEASIYRGSHNLIPFEFVIHFLFSLPAVAGAYLGRYISYRASQPKKP